jgi:uncharacterized protein (TIGR03435 family)
MTWTKTKTVAMGIILLAVIAIVVITKGLSPQIKDSYFTLNYLHFQTVPANLVAVRPTHFTNSPGSIFTTTTPNIGQDVPRMLGRDVPLEQVMATAYSCGTFQIVLPPDSPHGNFDYLVTVAEKPREHLQAAIHKKLGYVAHWEDRDTDVLLLETTTPHPAGLVVSTASTATRGNVSFRDEKYWFTHMPVRSLLGFLQHGLNQPVLDRTDLTNFYDFSITASWRGGNGRDEAEMKEMLATLGLKLEPSHAPFPKLVVEKVN